MKKRGQITAQSQDDESNKPQTFFEAVVAPLLFIPVALLICAGVLAIIVPVVRFLFGPSTPPPSYQVESVVRSSGNYARFEGADPDAVAKLSILLANGSYELEFVADAQLGEFDKSTAFIANVRTGEVAGDLVTARTIVLVGNWKVVVAAIGEEDRFLSSIGIHDNSVRAYFDYAQSERGPPIRGDSTTRKKIIVVGQVTEFNLPDAAGSSFMDIRVLDLGRRTTTSEDGTNFSRPGVEPGRPNAEATRRPTTRGR